jgi:hypothetical protein
LAVALGAALAVTLPSTSASSSAGTRIVITEKGKGYPGNVDGKFALSGTERDSGTSHLFGSESGSERYVDGQRQEGGAGGGVYDGKKGGFEIRWKGTRVDLNSLESVLTGTWRLTGGTGIYKTWKGGGRFVVVEAEPSGGRMNTYEARWEGLVSRK